MTLDEEIEQTENEIKIMRLRLSQLRHRKALINAEVDRLVAFVKDHPGADRYQLQMFFAEYTRDELSDLITKARRSRQVIENRGTRSCPKWHLV